MATTSSDSGLPSAVGEELGNLSPDRNSRNTEASEKTTGVAGNGEVGKVSDGDVRSPPSPTGGDESGAAEAPSAADSERSDDSHAGKGKGPAAAAQKSPGVLHELIHVCRG